MIPVKIPFLLIWTGLFRLWLGISTAVYTCIVLIIRPFSYNAAYAVARNWCRLVVLFSGIRLTVEGMENLDRQGHYMFIINHTSAYDIPILVMSIPLHINFIAKKELFSIPFFGQGIRALGHIPLNRSNPRKAHASIKNAVKQVREKHRSMMLFPEGTRSLTGRVGEFKRASFALVKEAGITMVPILIHGADKVANKKSWYLSPGPVKLIISDPVDETTVCTATKEELMEMAHNRIVALQEEQFNRTPCKTK
jgi:1-acyl-sn-glycerol-3-phosphate acyltransferase